jgi:hypothetical protein
MKLIRIDKIHGRHKNMNTTCVCGHEIVDGEFAYSLHRNCNNTKYLCVTCGNKNVLVYQPKRTPHHSHFSVYTPTTIQEEIV